MADAFEAGDVEPSVHVRDVVGGKACYLVSDGVAAGELGLNVDVRDAADGEKVLQEEF